MRDGRPDGTRWKTWAECDLRCCRQESRLQDRRGCGVESGPGPFTKLCRPLPHAPCRLRAGLQSQHLLSLESQTQVCPECFRQCRSAAAPAMFVQSPPGLSLLTGNTGPQHSHVGPPCSSGEASLGALRLQMDSEFQTPDVGGGGSGLCKQARQQEEGAG